MTGTEPTLLHIAERSLHATSCRQIEAQERKLHRIEETTSMSGKGRFASFNWNDWPLTFHLPMAGSKQPSALPVHGHVQQQGASAGRLGTFTGSSQDIYRKQGSAVSSGVGKPVARWRPTAFDFKSGSSTICPTCQGTGRIPKGTCVKRGSGANVPTKV